MKEIYLLQLQLICPLTSSINKYELIINLIKKTQLKIEFKIKYLRKTLEPVKSYDKLKLFICKYMSILIYNQLIVASSHEILLY